MGADPIEDPSNKQNCVLDIFSAWNSLVMFDFEMSFWWSFYIFTYPFPFPYKFNSELETQSRQEACASSTTKHAKHKQHTSFVVSIVS